MKKITIFALLLSFPLTAFAGGSFIKTQNQENVAAFGWNGAKSRVLTIASTVIDMTSDLYYSVFPSVAGCKVRSMPLSTSTKASYVLTPENQNVWSTPSAVNPATPFINFSGCTGYLKKQ